MRTAQRLGFVLLLALASGCAAVVASAPVGETPVQLAADDWEGTWLHVDGAVDIQVEDATAGVLRLAWVEGDGGSPSLESTSLHLRHAGDRMLASMPVPDAREPQYLWGMVLGGDNEMIVLAPDVDAFRALVADGTLPGRAENGDVALGELGTEHLQLIVDHQRGFLFELDEPLVLRRVAR